MKLLKKTSLILFMLTFFVIGCNKKEEQKKNTEKEVVLTTETNTTVEITDMAGRKVMIPKEINKIYTMSPVGQMYIYNLNPDKLAGWVYELSDKEKAYLDEKYQNLPVLGGNYGKGNKMNPETIIKEAPDIVIMMGKKNESSVQDADDAQKQLGIPVVFVEFDLMNLDKAYYFAAESLGEPKGKELGDYTKELLEMVSKNAQSIPEDKKVKIFYSEGMTGLQTDPSGSPHAAVIDKIGAINVAEIESKNGYGRVEVSFEQLLMWDPDVIIIYADYVPENDFYAIISKDQNFSQLRAVKAGKYYETPFAPFNWFDRPPSPNQLLGLLWLGNLIYPEIYNYNMTEKAKEFGKLFYHLEWSDEDLSKILSRSQTK